MKLFDNKIINLCVVFTLLMALLVAIPLLSSKLNASNDIMPSENDIRNTSIEEVTVPIDYQTYITAIEGEETISPIFSLTREAEGRGVWQIGTIKSVDNTDGLSLDAIKYMEAWQVDKELYVKASDGIKARLFPNILYENVYKILSYGKSVKVVGESDNGWVIIEIGDTKCFVWGDLLTTEKPVKEETSPTAASGSSLGVYELTAYCNCEKCNGKWAWGPTASGKMPVQGRTVACNSIKMGTQVMIRGHVYTVEDTGAMGDNVVDIYFDNHSEALAFGRQKAEVFKVQ